MTPGHPAPPFDLPATTGRATLAALHGAPAVLYFYPRADTPGCTKEAQAFQDALPDYNVPVLGISKDPLPALHRFAAKYGLTFPLASDDAQVAEAYGAWVEKAMYGKTYMGVDRSTVLLDARGCVAHVWRKVRVPGHAAEVLAALRAL